ncbi:hypothetical protein TIFTF001_022521 [Ficus carica]|uniref:R13L1/DRL21-like LRR repeat region domain-containing protein n=1 Tax=Ficus carica TaxID=3494 RepID=A0AA88AZK2_FICCA|nr:hypothetical protein TIFTF001_022521 [Ficus carica]
MGDTISSKWKMALINLKSLSLQSCEECVFLPPLGKLPSLEDLNIGYFKRMERLGVELLGIENDDNAGAPMSHQISLFPKLKRLQFGNLGSCHLATDTVAYGVISDILP